VDDSTKSMNAVLLPSLDGRMFYGLWEQERGFVCPGGKFEIKSDYSLKDCAHREAQEEIGINVYSSRFVGCFPDVDGGLTAGFVSYNFNVSEYNKHRKIITIEQLLESKYHFWYEMILNILNYI